MPQMKKKLRNPAHVMLTDRINDLKQNINLLLENSVANKLMDLAMTRTTPARS